MTQTINGKRYSTETATKVAEYSNGLGRRDFKYIYEDLYITKNGSWFIEYDGGAATSYSTAAGNMRDSGSGIKPLSKEEALAWLERHNQEDAIAEYFADEIEEA